MFILANKSLTIPAALHVPFVLCYNLLQVFFPLFLPIWEIVIWGQGYNTLSDGGENGDMGDTGH